MDRPLGVIGVPTSAGAFAPGQEQAPRALRDAGLIEMLRDRGLEVHDHGDCEAWRWRPDREHRHAQNAEHVERIARDTAARVGESAAAGEVVLVLGGDCTVGIGTVAGQVQTGERVGLVYFDTHADLNIPASVREGALDWMGMAHMLGVDGAVPDIVHIGPNAPLLDPEQVVLFGWGPEQATEFERHAIERLGLETVAVGELASDPEGAASHVCARMEASCDRLVVHFDVDVIDFTDTPLSENTGRNEGLPYEVAMRALRGLLGSPHLRAVTITELNPDHTEAGANTLARFARSVTDALAG